MVFPIPTWLPQPTVTQPAGLDLAAVDREHAAS